MAQGTKVLKRSSSRKADRTTDLCLACEDDELSPAQLECAQRAAKEYDEVMKHIALLKSKNVKLLYGNENTSVSQLTNSVISTPAIKPNIVTTTVTAPISSTTNIITTTPAQKIIELPKLVPMPQSQLIIQNTVPIAPQPQTTVLQPASYKLLLDTRTGLIIGTLPGENQTIITKQRPTSLLPTTQAIALVPIQCSNPNLIATNPTPIAKSAPVIAKIPVPPEPKKPQTKVISEPLPPVEKEVDANNTANLLQLDNQQQRLPSQYPSLTMKATPQRLASHSVVQVKRTELDKTMNDVIKLSTSDLVKWTFEHGLFHIEHTCALHRDTKMQLVFDSRIANDNSGGYKWQCSLCARTIAIQHLSFFESQGLSLLTMLRIIYFWACNEDVQKVLQEVKISACFLRSVYSLLRSICGSKVKTLMKLGGSDRYTVEVCVLLWKGTCVYTSQLFLGCIYERNSGMVALRVFANKHDTLIEGFVEDFVAPHSVINTEKNIKLSYMFVAKGLHKLITTGDSGSGILNAKAYLEERVVPMFGNVMKQLQVETIQSFLHELMWREKFGTNPYNAFNNILLHIKQHYGTGTTTIKTTNQPLKMPFVSVLSDTKQTNPQASTSAGTSTNIILSKPNVARNIAPELPSSKLPKLTLPNKAILLDDYYYGWKSGITFLRKQATEMQQNYKFKCCVCKKLIDNNIKLMKHLCAHIEAIKQRNLDLSDVTQCKHCFRDFETPYVMQCHIEDVHLNSNSPKCRICDRAFNSKEILIKHMVQTHTAAEMPYSCDVCKFRSSMYKSLIDHFHQVHNDTNFVQCQYCLKVFSVKFSSVRQIGVINNFWTHIYKHQTKSLNRKCTACCLTFVGKNELKQHRLQDHCTFKDKPGVFKFVSNENKSKIYIKEPPLKARVMFRAKRKRTAGNQILQTCPRTSKYNFNSSTKHPGLTCFECRTEMDLPSHFLKSWSCSQCSYVSSCGKAFANHMILRHAKNRKREDIYTPVRLPYRMYCMCGYSDLMGNRMAKHLVRCGKRSCYRTEEIAESNALPSITEEPAGPPT